MGIMLDLPPEVFIKADLDFLSGLMYTGLESTAGGRFGEAPSLGLTESIAAMGFELGKLKKSNKAKQHIKAHVAIAEATFKKDARINVRISSRDLHLLQAKALMEGMPYQTLVSSILHKFIDGQLVDKSANKSFNLLPTPLRSLGTD